MEHYINIEKIGCGQFGAVYSAVDKRSGNKVALKRCSLRSASEGVPHSLLQEISAQRKISHPNVLPLLEVFIQLGDVYTVTPLMRGSLAELLQIRGPTLSRDVRRSMAHAILSGLAAIHDAFYLHRDLKPDNLLLRSDVGLCISDFGGSKCYGISDISEYSPAAITLWYRPPELLLGSRVCGPAIDMWSAGCILGEMFLQRPLFPGTTELNQLQRIFSVLGTPQSDTWPGVETLPNYIEFMPCNKVPLHELFPEASPGFITLMESLLVPNPQGRCTAKEALGSPYFKEGPLVAPSLWGTGGVT